MRTSATIKLGEIEVKRIGLGTNRITVTQQARAVLSRAAEHGPIFIDTADTYQNGESETTIGDTLAPYAEGVVIGTKGGMVRGSDPDNSEAHMRDVLESSLRRLKTDTIHLYQLHRIDTRIPVERTMELFKQFRKEGKIRHVGLSEVTVEQIERARKIIEITSVQNQYNLLHRDHDKVVDYCQQNWIVFIPWFPLSRGSIGQQGVIAEMAKRYHVTPAQLALAWLLKRSPVMLPIPGTLSIEHLDENLSALDIELGSADYDLLSK